MTSIIFDHGTLVLEDVTENIISLLHEFIVFDERIDAWRARACDYAQIIIILHRAKQNYRDLAKKFQPLDLELKTSMNARDYQQLALEKWLENGSRGVVVLPTGSGKSFFANLCIVAKKRPTLVVVPTIDLMLQWHSQLSENFQMEIGLLGGGNKLIKEITVSTYDSAVIHMEYLGGLFGLLIFDECHHLPGAVNRNAALMSIAPFRLGITATPERNDDGEHLLYKLLGPLVYRIEINQLEGNVLANYQTVQLEAMLTSDEQERYDHARKIYIDFIRNNGIDFSRDGWSQFIIKACRRPGGKEALKAFLEQKRISRTCESKFSHLWDILLRHGGERIIIFTADNDTAYAIGKHFMLPVITHHTKGSERKEMLALFRTGDYKVLVTSKVLNEGIDVPEASVGVVVSGSGSIREHVQRLGRILRPSENKKAMLYELISANTAEVFISERRRQHLAYQK